MIKLTTGACSKYCSNKLKAKKQHHLYLDPTTIESIEDTSETQDNDFGFNTKIVTHTGHEHFVCETSNIVLGLKVAEEKRREKEDEERVNRELSK
jgi:hypothetical protein